MEEMTLPTSKDETRAVILSLYRENRGVWRVQSAFAALGALLIAMLPFYVLQYGDAVHVSFNIWFTITVGTMALFLLHVMACCSGMVYTALRQLRGQSTHFFHLFIAWYKPGTTIDYWFSSVWQSILLFIVLPILFFIIIYNSYLFPSYIDVIVVLLPTIIAVPWWIRLWGKRLQYLAIVNDDETPAHNGFKIISNPKSTIADIHWLMGWVRRTGLMWAAPCMLLLSYFCLELSILEISVHRIMSPYSPMTFWLGPPVMPSLSTGLLFGMMIGMLAAFPRLALGMAAAHIGHHLPECAGEQQIRKQLPRSIRIATAAAFLLLLFVFIRVAVNMPFRETRPLHYAIKTSNHRLAHLLLHLGANPNSNDLLGDSALGTVTSNNDAVAAQLLFTHGANGRNLRYLPFRLSFCPPAVQEVFKRHDIQPDPEHHY